MPQNKRENFIFTIVMCFVMVIWMSTYNIAIIRGGLSLEVFEEAWLAVPIAGVIAFIADWFLVSKISERFAFRFLVKPTSKPWKVIVAITCCTIIPMVFIMSLYGTIEACIETGDWSSIWLVYFITLPRNLVMALPFQLLIAGPLVRFVFRKAFPEGKILA